MPFKFEENTCDKVKKALIDCYHSKSRIRIWYGDTDTGVPWLDEYDIIGTVGRSGGQVKIPLLLKNARSSGGGGILTNRIIRIDIISSKHTIYEHPLFCVPKLEVYPNLDDETKVPYPFIVLKYGTIQARFKTDKKAYKYIDFMNGKRYTMGGV